MELIWDTGAIVTLLIGIVWVASLFWAVVRVLGKAGLSKLWVLLVFVPAFQVISLWILAFVKWPNRENVDSNNSKSKPRLPSQE